MPWSAAGHPAEAASAAARLTDCPHLHAHQTLRFRVPECRRSFSDSVPCGWVSPADRVTDNATQRLRQRLCREYKGAHGEVRALPGRAPMERRWTHAPDAVEALEAAYAASPYKHAFP